MFELQAADKGLAFRFEPSGALPARGARRREAACARSSSTCWATRSSSPQRGQVTLRAALCARDGRVRDRGHRARHVGRRARAHLRALRARRARPAGGARRRPGPDDRQDADRPDGRRDDGAAARPAQGSVFRMRLFLPRVHDAPAAAPRAARRRRARARLRGRAPAPAGGRQRGGRPRAAARSVLAPLGFELRTAASGHDALRPARGRLARPTRCSMDLAMPGIDGWETIRRARALGPDATRRWRSSRPTPSTSGWTTTSASRPRTSSSSRCATASCSTGSSARLALAVDRQRRAARRAAAPRRGRGARCRPTRALRALEEAVEPGLLSRHHEPARRHRRRRSPSARPGPAPSARWRGSSSSRR